MIGVGVIGTGFGRAVHIPGFLAVQGATVIGVASGSEERARQVAAEYSLPKFFASWQALIDCPQIQAVSIATPPSMQIPIALAALAAGKAVLCEKPLTLSVTEATRMLEAARRARVVHMVDFEFREHPAWRFAKQLIDAGELGSLRSVTITWVVGSWANPSRPWSWRWDRAQGGGVLGALGIHVFDYIEWLLNPVKSLVANLSIRVAQRPDLSGAWRPVTAEDCCHLLLELSDGTPVNLTISCVAPLGKGHWIEFCGERKVIVVGSDSVTDYGKGFHVWEGFPGSTCLKERPLPQDMEFKQEFTDGRTALFAKLAQHFENAIQQGQMDVQPSFADGLRAQVMLETALQANEERRWVDIPRTRQEVAPCPVLISATT